MLTLWNLWGKESSAVLFFPKAICIKDASSSFCSKHNAKVCFFHAFHSQLPSEFIPFLDQTLPPTVFSNIFVCQPSEALYVLQ